MMQRRLKPIYFYHLAKDLKECTSFRCDQSAIDRTIVDRLYYSVFLAYKGFLKSYPGFSPSDNGDDHEYVQEFIKSNRVFNKNSYKIANCIFKLRLYRGDASYILSPTKFTSEIGDKTMKDIFKDTETLFDKINISCD